MLRSLWKHLKPCKYITKIFNNMLSLNNAPNYSTWFYLWRMQGGAAQRGTPGYNGTPGYCVVHHVLMLSLILSPYHLVSCKGLGWALCYSLGTQVMSLQMSKEFSWDIISLLYRLFVIQTKCICSRAEYLNSRSMHWLYTWMDAAK